MANKVKYTTQEAKEKYNQLVTKGKYKEGLNILYALYKKDQSDIQVLSSLGLINETINNIDEAIAFYKEAISKGNLEKAITEIDTLEVASRGALDAWLKEAKAKKDASVAAENILAKTTAALKIKN